MRASRDGREPGPAAAREWASAAVRLLAAVDPRQQAEVKVMLEGSSAGGIGLRCWLSAVAWGASRLPAALPFELTQVYLDDPEAAPLAECPGCGLALPAVRPAGRGRRRVAHFAVCPACGAAERPALHERPGRSGGTLTPWNVRLTKVLDVQRVD